MLRFVLKQHSIKELENRPSSKIPFTKETMNKYIKLKSVFLHWADAYIVYISLKSLSLVSQILDFLLHLSFGRINQLHIVLFS